MNKVLMILNKNGSNGGPYISHMRIAHSDYMKDFDFSFLYYEKASSFLNPFKAIRFIKSIRKSSCSIIQIAGLQMESFILCFLSKLAFSGKVVLVVHGSSSEALCLGRFKKRLHRFFEKMALRLCDRCYGVSNYVSSWKICSKFKKKYYGTIYNMSFNKYDKSLLPQNNWSIRAKYGIPENAFLISSTGRITIEKGYKTVLQIIKETKNQDVWFIIVGNGHFLQSMKTELKNYNNVVFTDYQQNVSSFVSESNLFLTCTLHETLGNSIIEALTLGVPVVATRVGGVPEIVRDGENGFLVDGNDASSFLQKIMLLKNNPDKYKEFKNNTLLINDVINEQKIADKISDVYRKVLNK